MHEKQFGNKKKQQATARDSIIQIILTLESPFKR